MSTKDRSNEELLLEIDRLCEQLAEAEETLRAIRSGEVDAFVLSGEKGEQVFTLKGAEQPYRILIEEMGEGAVMLDNDTSILYCNSGFARMLNMQLEKLIGTGISQFISPAYQQVFEELLRLGRAGRSKGEVTFLAENGMAVPTYISMNAVQMDATQVVNLVATDLTEIKLAEDHIREQAALLRKEIIERKQIEVQIREQATLLDKAQDAIGVRDLDHNLIYWNKGAQRLYGWTADEAIGKNADELLYRNEPRLIEAEKIVMEKGEWTGELHQVTKDGKEIDVESRWTLVRDDTGKPKSILIINTDITEKNKLEAQFLRAQRFESIGTLAGGIAHDINNVLTPILLSVQLLKEKLKDEQSEKLLAILETSTRRGASLMKQVMSFARGVDGERNVVPTAHLIAESMKIAKETFPKSIEIRNDVQEDIWVVSGDATQLYQVIMNLCVNARDAMKSGGILRIKAENFLVDENFAHMNIDAKAGPYIVITVSDTGTGIPPKILDRIFEPFFTTKEHGKGTGLGLSTVLTIVKSHGGFINVYSEVGKGTSFKVYFPAIPTAETQKAKEQLLEFSSGHGELVLVAEDEASIREITRSTLESYGYKVLIANDGTEAVALYAQNKDMIKVVIMDMMMPVMDGPTSCRAIHRISPDAKIIAVSGLTDKDRLARVAEYSNAFLPKPYTTAKLLKTIHEVLNL